MPLKNFFTKILVASLSCTVALVTVSRNAVAFDFHLQGTFGSSNTPPSTLLFFSDFASFSGTISTPGNEPISTYTGLLDINTLIRQVPTFSINYYNIQGDVIYSQGINGFGSRQLGAESLTPDGGRELDFGDQLTGISLIFSAAPANPSALSFSSGSFSISSIAVGQGGSSGYFIPVTSASITPIPVPEPCPIGGVLFVTGLSYWLWRKKPQPAKMLNVIHHNEL